MTARGIELTLQAASGNRFGSKHYLIAGTELRQEFTEHFLGCAIGISVGRIHQGAPGVQENG
ncbi:unannotated protein [freshwater metagenome]|uniref:Unannotated protein n=1 Tax=freshwater metagenome TaxID=449393 RepID=A0A6J6N3K7_9ZZZZ